MGSSRIGSVRANGHRHGTAGDLRLLVRHRERAYLATMFAPDATAERIAERWEKLEEARAALAALEGERPRRRRRGRGRA